MPSLMTGNANTMTIPQIDKVISKLNDKLKEPGVKNNETLTTKIENLLSDYTKAKNKILRYYEKTKSRFPELVVGKKNTLTLVQIYKNQGKQDKALKLSQKSEKWSYNVADFLKDTRGFAAGIAITAGTLGVANIVSNAVAQKGIMEVIKNAIVLAFKSQPLSASLITAGLAIGGACLLVPKIARTVHKIKNNKTKAREMNNEILNETSVDLDAKQNVEEIKNFLLANDALKAQFADPAFDWAYAGFTNFEKSKIKLALKQIELDEAQATRDNLTELGRQTRQKLDYDKYLEAYSKARANVANADDYAQTVADLAQLQNTEIPAQEAAVTTAEGDVAMAEADVVTKQAAFDAADAAFRATADATTRAAFDAARADLQTAKDEKAAKDVALKNAKTNLKKTQTAVANIKKLHETRDKLKKLGLDDDAKILKAVDDFELAQAAAKGV